MKKKLLIFAATLQLFCGIPFIQSQQETDIPAFPEGEEISEEEFAKLVERMVQEIEKEIKQEEVQKTKSEIKKTPQTKPSSTLTISTNKKNNLRQSWIPTKEEEALPPLKKETLDFYLSKLMDNFSLIQENLAGLSSYGREKFAPYKVDIDKTISYLGQIKGEEIYLTSLYNDKFKDLRESLLHLNEELERINRDIRVKTGEEETTVEELYEAERKEKTEKFEDSVEEKTIKQPSISKTTKSIPEKKEVIPSKIADQKIKKLSTLPWYQKLLNWIFNFLKEGWNYIISLFVSKKEDLQPIKKEIPQTLPPKEKQPKATEKESPDEFLELMNVMQEGLKEIKKDKSPDKAKPSYHATAKMAWKKFLKLLQQGELKKLNDQFKAVINFSAKAIEEERKKEEEKVKKAEEDKRQREEREGRPTPSTYPSIPYYPYYEPYQPYQAPTHNTYHPGSVSSGYSPTVATSPTQQAHPSKKSAKPSESSKTTTDEDATKTPGGFYAPSIAKTPIVQEKKLKSEIIEFINNLETNYKDKLTQATLQPQPYPQTVPQLVEAVEKGLGKIKKKQEKLVKVISKFSNENRKENEEWKKQDEEYNENLKKLALIKNDLQVLKQ